MKRILTIILVACLLSSQLTVHASSGSLTASNKYSYTSTTVTTHTVTVPYTGNYTVTVSSAEGGHVGGTYGGKGHILTQTVRLAKGTTVTATLGNKGTVNGANVGRGQSSTLTIGNTTWTVPGGVGVFNSDTGARDDYTLIGDTNGSVVLHTHIGNSTSGGACYQTVVKKHVHKAACTGHVHDSSCVSGAPEHMYDGVNGTCRTQCSRCGLHIASFDGPYYCDQCRRNLTVHNITSCAGKHSNNTGYVCNNLPKNTVDHYELSCMLPRVVSHVPAVDSSTLPYNSETVAQFTISLCDTNSLFMSRGVIKAPAYKAIGAGNYTNVSLVLRDDIVLFYKRN